VAAKRAPRTAREVAAADQREGGVPVDAGAPAVTTVLVEVRLHRFSWVLTHRPIFFDPRASFLAL
jgi:hypothetical protein